MSFITEEDFRKILSFNLCKDPLLDRNILTIIYSFNYFIHVNDELETACQGGHKNWVTYAIIKGANYWDLGLRGACRGGHKHLALLMIKKGSTHYNYGLIGACRGGHKKLVMLMLKKGAYNFNDALSAACFQGHKDIAIIILDKGINTRTLSNASLGLYKTKFLTSH